MISNTADSLLEEVYDKLGFLEGDLLATAEGPSDSNLIQWVEKGEWLSLGKKAGVEKVFFVEDNPVIVFARVEGSDAEEPARLDDPTFCSVRTFFNRIWCMSRPQLLFLAQPGELSVYDLTKPPVRRGEKLSQANRRLTIVRSIPEVQLKLQEYHRIQVESGRLFEEKHFGQPTDRADESLIRDLKAVRNKLMIDLGLKKEYAHRLIGRSIFIRYLEDREILVPDYFRTVASTSADWMSIVDAPSNKADVDPEMEKKYYPKILEDKEFTYALFDQLAQTFNGDMFPIDLEEKKAVTLEHLHCLQRFFRGDLEDQEKLFFFAYKFDIIPIELISSIYEEFYNDENGTDNNQGSHYTRSTLVEFLLSRVLTKEWLNKQPCIIDPACGSGIFLVEAYRRIVRHRVQGQNGNPISSTELRDILRDQVRGIDINHDAVRIAAFSLYLALLHYQEPKDILKNPKLPHLEYRRPKEEGHEYFDILLPQNAFDFESLISGVEEEVRSKFSSRSADIVVGNPPWGYPKPGDKKGREAAKVMLDWCQRPPEPPTKHVGYKEPSQAFIHKTIDLLREGGKAGLLVSSGVFFKRGNESRKFRKQWLTATTLEHVVNFAHVRRIFFSGSGRKTKAVAPFASIVFTKKPPEQNSVLEYWSAKRSGFAARSKSVVMSKADLQLISQAEAINDDTLWKVNWWGNHRDQALIQTLRINQSLERLSDEEGTLVEFSGRGFMVGTPSEDAEDSNRLKGFKEYPTEKLERYGSIEPSDLRDLPSKLERERTAVPFEGLRLLVKQSPSKRKNRGGQIIARLETERYCFRHSVYSFRLRDSLTWEARVLLGILWSSLTQYYLFLTTSSWGNWHDKVSLDEIRNLPVRLPRDEGLRNRITSIVDELRNLTSPPMGVPSGDLFSQDSSGRKEQIESREPALQDELDEAIFDLFELTASERDQVRDMCELGLDLFYKHTNGNATQPLSGNLPRQRYGVLQDVTLEPAPRDSLERYLRAFLRMWNKEMEPDSEFRWELIRHWQVVRPGKNPPMIAVVFSTQYKDKPLPAPNGSDEEEWSKIIQRLSEYSIHNYGSHNIYTDGLVRVVADPDIIVIKRNQQRLWTPSMAREDAEATMLQAMLLQEEVQSR